MSRSNSSVSRIICRHRCRSRRECLGGNGSTLKVDWAPMGGEVFKLGMSGVDVAHHIVDFECLDHSSPSAE